MLTIMLALGTVGCEATGSPESTKKTALKVLYDSEDAYYEDFGMLFAAQHPNLEVEVVPTRGVSPKDMNRYIQEKKPDVFILDQSDVFEQYAQDGLLYDLDPLIKRDKFNLEGVVPAVLDTVKAMGGGKLYGLAPHFSSQALYYNKTLFDKAGIPYPKDRMSWEEVMQLAQRFSSGKGDSKDRTAGIMLGLYAVHPYYMGLEIGRNMGLASVDQDKMKMIMDTSEWKNVYQLSFGAMKSGALFSGEVLHTPGMDTSAEMKQHPFIGGKTAMALGHSDFLRELKRAQDVLKDQMPVWDIVTVPVDPKKPDVGNQLWIKSMTAIAANAANVEDAWKFVSYFNGDTYASATSKVWRYGAMPSRTAYLKDMEGHSLQAFYALRPDPDAPKGGGKIPQSFYMPYEALAKKELQDAYDGRQSIDKALKTIQRQGQQILDQSIVAEKDKTPTQ
ncbi:extracellular solute-binding protein [Paenibacillus filicis]|uniref:Extracellular solute-binding protein n=1 Tax=Paenibacillus filicis TaxID=669464 RepID=A0ABU9DPN9_9BACL